MDILIDGLGKQFTNKWVFRDLSAQIPFCSSIGISGPNGSGKSTLLNIICGAMPQTEGDVLYFRDSINIDLSGVFRHVAIAAPYADLIEEMTLKEACRFHTQFRAFRNGLTAEDLIDRLGPGFPANLQISAFSSGMKQRLRIAMALFTDAALVFLDEPTSNLDAQGKAWYRDLVDEFEGESTLVVASNDADDMAFCDDFIHLPDYSPGK